MLGWVQMVKGRALAIHRSNRYLVPILLVESKACPGMGWRMCVEVVIGCAQPDGWKITSVKPTVEWFLSGSGSEGSHISHNDPSIWLLIGVGLSDSH